MDTVTTEQRSAIMRKVHSTDTGAEWKLRRLVYGMGYRYRLHIKDLPGKPDLVFRDRKKVIFVHGCFWHCHEGCKRSRIPSSNRDYWSKKLEANVRRDIKNLAALDVAGWRTLIVWECELRELAALQERIKEFLDG